MLNRPSLSAVAVPTTTFPFKRVTLEFASAVPVIVGVESFVAVSYPPLPLPTKRRV